ncbi:hypothetical protein [Micromonospora sp. RP3T]|uniref:hypothetical protein n=1 Tax=Micromonospora sp. RP3T TaxID=2135446 RepID=UPI003D70ED0D
MATRTTTTVSRPEVGDIVVHQPPQTILVKGERVDVSKLKGDALYEAIITDEEHWDYPRLHAETGRSVVRLRVWVTNARNARRSGKAPTDTAFIEPKGDNGGVTGGSPFWYAGKAREALIAMGGIMRRDGVAIPPKPVGRTKGAKDKAPRQPWKNAPARDAAAGIYREYVQLTTRKRGTLTDREARAELCRKYGLSRPQLARRITAGQEQAGHRKTDVDKAALRARLAELVAEERAAGYAPSGAEDRARTALAKETGLTRRQIGGYVPAAELAEPTGETG